MIWGRNIVSNFLSPPSVRIEDGKSGGIPLAAREGEREREREIDDGKGVSRDGDGRAHRQHQQRQHATPSCFGDSISFPVPSPFSCKTGTGTQATLTSRRHWCPWLPFHFLLLFCVASLVNLWLHKLHLLIATTATITREEWSSVWLGKGSETLNGSCLACAACMRDCNITRRWCKRGRMTPTTTYLTLTEKKDTDGPKRNSRLLTEVYNKEEKASIHLILDHTSRC